MSSGGESVRNSFVGGSEFNTGHMKMNELDMTESRSRSTGLSSELHNGGCM